MTKVLNVTATLGAAAICIMGVSGMSQQVKPNLSVGCTVQNSKAVLSDDTCDLFVQEMAEAFADRGVVRAAGGVQPDVVLVVTEATSSRFLARIDHNGVQGPELAAARKGAPLDNAALSNLFRGLIQSTSGL